MAESFDAVLAEVEEIAQYVAIHYPEADDALHDRIMQAKARLQSAHEAEVTELRTDLAGVVDGNIYAVQRAEQERLRADRAVGLLRIIQGAPVSGLHEWLPMIDAFLSEQAGERENGDG